MNLHNALEIMHFELISIETANCYNGRLLID